MWVGWRDGNIGLMLASCVQSIFISEYPNFDDASGADAPFVRRQFVRERTISSGGGKGLKKI